LTLDYLWLYCISKNPGVMNNRDPFFSRKPGQVPHDANPYHEIMRAKGNRNCVSPQFPNASHEIFICVLLPGFTFRTVRNGPASIGINQNHPVLQKQSPPLIAEKLNRNLTACAGLGENQDENET